MVSIISYDAVHELWPCDFWDDVINNVYAFLAFVNVEWWYIPFAQYNSSFCLQSWQHSERCPILLENYWGLDDNYMVALIFYYMKNVLGNIKLNQDNQCPWGAKNVSSNCKNI